MRPNLSIERTPTASFAVRKPPLMSLKEPSMQSSAIFYPVLVLVLWTLLVLLLVPFVRIRAANLHEVTAGDFLYGESDAVPPWVRLPNRNYMNLLELPVLFYVVCIVAFVTGSVSPATVSLAWGFVGLRVLHSLIHLTYNNVLHRLGAMALGSVVLVVLVVQTLVALFSR